MLSSELAKSELAKFWRDPSLGDVDLLRASYITHSFARHTHDCYAIGVIEAGVEEFSYRGATHRAPANAIVIVHPGEVHTGHAGVPTGWQYRMFYPSVSLLQQAQAELGRSSWIPYFPTAVISDPGLARQLHSLHMALERAESRLESESRFLYTFAQLIARHADCRSCLPAPLSHQPDHQTDHQTVRLVRDYLDAHSAESVGLDQLAALTQLKPLRLLRLFQRQIGLPPHAYLVQLRVERAKALLRTGLPIAQVAYDTGFTDQSHLNRHFKKLTGITPGQYVTGCKLVL
jgi:AraC-like DNA-binding protein